MARMTGDEARQYLASLPEFAAGDKGVGDLSDAYARRLAGRARRDLAEGRTPSRQAARGHILTPEHPGGAAPKLPEPASVYKQRVLTPPAPQAPAPARVHNRPPFQGYVPFGDGGEVYTETSEAGAMRVIRYAAKAGPEWGEPLVMQVYDCGKGQWLPVFHHGHGRGFNAGALLEQLRDRGQTLEQYLMDLISARKSDVTAQLDHICLYEVTILPRPPANVAALARGRR